MACSFWMVLFVALFMEVGGKHTILESAVPEDNNNGNTQQDPASEAFQKAYTREFLYGIGEDVRHKHSLRTLSIQVCLHICSLRIQRCRKRGRKGGWKQCFDNWHPDVVHSVQGQGCHNSSPCLHWIDTDKGPQFSSNLMNNVRICFLNAQSLKSKDTTIHQFLLEANIDICIVVESWIHDTDIAWMTGTDMVKDNFKGDSVNRSSPGGGLALFYKDHFDCERHIILQQPNTYEVVTWLMKLREKCFTIQAVYRPPQNHPGKSISAFTMEFTTNLEETILHYPNPVLLGDFNIHVNDVVDVEAMDCVTTLETLGLDQHVKFCTHQAGHQLDLIITPHLMELSIIRCIQGPFFSDHSSLIVTLGLIRPQWTRQCITYHRLKSVDPETFGPILYGMLAAVNQNQLGDPLANNLHVLMTTLLDVFALEKSM